MSERERRERESEREGDEGERKGRGAPAKLQSFAAPDRDIVTVTWEESRE